MTLTPGAYLKCRRTACGKSVPDVACAIETDPSVSEADRVEWLRSIEADVAPARWSTIVALRRLVRFDLLVLERLSLIHAGVDLPEPRICRICAVGNALIDLPWEWAEADLCIACASES